MGTISRKCILVVNHFKDTISVHLVSKKGLVLGSASKSFSVLESKEGFIEYDALAVIYTLRSVINSLYTDYKLKPGLIESIALLTQEQYFLVWDKDTGNPLTPIISRDCMRAKEERLFFIETSVTSMIKEQSGFSVSPQSPGLKLKYLSEKNEDLKLSLDRGKARFGTMDSWLLYHLTGQLFHVTDISNAAKTQLYNPREGSWDRILMEEWGITKGSLPRVYPSDHMFGETKGFVPLRDGIPITFVGVHQVATMLSLPQWRLGAGHLHFGDEPKLMIHLGSDLGRIMEQNDHFITFFQGDSLMYALEVPLLSWQSLMGCFGKNGDAHLMDPDLCYFSEHLPIIVPYKHKKGDSNLLSGLFTIVGVFSEMSVQHKEASVLVSLVHLIKETLCRYEHNLGVRLKELSIDGDLADSQFFVQVLADLLQMGIIKYSQQELSRIGAMMRAAVQTAFVDPKEFRKINSIEKTVLPNLDPLSSYSKHQYWETSCR